MRRRHDVLKELTAADPVRRDQVETHSSPAAQRLLAAILSTPRQEPSPAAKPRSRSRLGVALAIVALAVAALAATWILTRPVTQPQALACFQAPNLDADRVGVRLGPSEGQAACEALWADSTLSNPDFGPPGTVPPLVACVSEAGWLFVFPGDDPGLCTRLGLAIPDPGSMPDADAIRALTSALVDYFSDQQCIPIPQAVIDVREILDTHVGPDWSISSEPGTDDRPCASFGLDAEERTVFLVPIPEPAS